MLLYKYSLQANETGGDILDNREMIQNSIDYIEHNLTAEITAEELADMSGFSLYHYYRLFRSATGMSVKQYILNRRLLNALHEISCGKSMIEAALLYGFDTFAGFYRACKRETGYTPSEFLKRYRAEKPYKIILFKEEHIMLSHKKISAVLKSWELESAEIKDIYHENTGNRNDNAYYIGDEYVLKLTADLGRLKKHIELSNALEGAGLLAASAVTTADGRDHIESDGLYFCLTKRLCGRQLSSAEILKGDLSESRQIGETIARLHIILKDLDIASDEADLYETVINRAMPKVRELITLPDKICGDYISVFGDIRKKLPKQLIHRDPNPGNIITDGEKWGFIDFELSEHNIRIFDICYAATAVLSERFSDSGKAELCKWIKCYKETVRGYDSVSALSKEEKTALPYVVLSNQLICTAWFSETEKFRNIFETNVKMTEWLLENFDELII